MNDTGILDRILDPLADAVITPETAERLVALRADDKTQARLDELAGKCNAGTLSEDEESEHDTYLAAIDFISILQAKARALRKR